MPSAPLPDFRSPTFLRHHIAQTMAFYHPRAIDVNGGFFHYFKDDGTIYDSSHRHLVSSTRFVFNYAMAYMEFANPDYLQAVKHGLHYLREVHRNPITGGYAWTLRFGQAEDTTNHCYGLAFVLLAYSCGLKVGISQAQEWMNETWDVLETYFWEEEYGLYRDEADTHWNFSDYRGQNANMHLCEALLIAFEATHHPRYLERALQLAKNMTLRQAGKVGGLVWEHYDKNWNIDWNYNRDNPKHLFRPWGFQPGHQAEWAKLLLILYRHTRSKSFSHLDTGWLLTISRFLFNSAVAHAWDNKHGGLYYGFAPNKTICDSDKYFWVQAESIAAAALLAKYTGNTQYWEWYDRLWGYAFTHMIDHQHGAWYRILTADNRKYNDEKSPAGKTDYHTMGACYEVLNSL